MPVRSWFRVIVPAALAAAIPGLLPAAEFTPDSRVTEVVVYRQQALVTREARVTLPPGEHRVILAEIPAVADPNSLRVTGTGTGGMSITGVEVRQEFREPRLSPEYQALEKELEELTRQQSGLDDRQRAIGSLREFLASLKATAGQESSKDLLTRGFAVESWQKAFTFLSERLNGLAEEERGIAAKRKEIASRIEVVRQKLQQLASQGGIQRGRAEVLVSAPRGGEMTLRASYLAHSASWTPLYDARLDASGGKVEILWQANVAQNTGEDWKGVAVTLSTTRPAAGIDLPKLATVRLTPVVPVEMRTAAVQKGLREDSKEYIQGPPVLGRDYEDVLTLAPGVTDTAAVGGMPAAPEPAPVPMEEAGSARRDVSVTFELPGKLDIPSDNEPHKHRIASKEMDAALEYRAVPRLVPAVYLAAKVTLPGEIPLLPGRVQHFVGVDLVGSSWMGDRAGGEEFALSFGPDDRLKAERKLVHRKVDQKGKDDETDYRFLTTLENRLAKDAVIELKDRIPVSGDERITVTLDESGTSAGFTTDPNEPGILTWKVTVPKGAKKEVTLRYRVRAPRNLPIAGME
jgi:uncharacterized protein (TIGR02231 family)